MDALEFELDEFREAFIAQCEKRRAQMQAKRTADRRYFTSVLAFMTVVLLSALARGFHWI